MMQSKLNHKRKSVMAEIQRRGLDVIQQGKAWRVCGSGVDVLVCDLSELDPINLTPARWAERGQTGAF